MSVLEVAVLRSSVGEDNYPDLVVICNKLDELGARLALSGEGLARVIATIAEEIVLQRVAIEAADAAMGALDLPEPPALCDTHGSEDP